MKNIAINPEDYTILAVDDIATNIMLLKAVLSRAKYKIVTASGGNEALEKAAWARASRDFVNRLGQKATITGASLAPI